MQLDVKERNNNRWSEYKECYKHIQYIDSRADIVKTRDRYAVIFIELYPILLVDIQAEIQIFGGCIEL